MFSAQQNLARGAEFFFVCELSSKKRQKIERKDNKKIAFRMQNST